MTYATDPVDWDSDSWGRNPVHLATEPGDTHYEPTQGDQ